MKLWEKIIIGLLCIFYVVWLALGYIIPVFSAGQNWGQAIEQHAWRVSFPEASLDRTAAYDIKEFCHIWSDENPYATATIAFYSVNKSWNTIDCHDYFPRLEKHTYLQIESPEATSTVECVEQGYPREWNFWRISICNGNN